MRQSVKDEKKANQIKATFRLEDDGDGLSLSLSLSMACVSLYCLVTGRQETTQFWLWQFALSADLDTEPDRNFGLRETKKIKIKTKQNKTTASLRIWDV